MKRRAILATPVIGVLFACAACKSRRGVRGADSAVLPPSKVADFKTLYEQNCAGCHGAAGKGNAAVALANPVFLAIADDDVIRRTAANGVPGTPMPAFAQSAGGMLTDRQIDALVRGIRSWEKPDGLRDATLPPYASQIPGDSQSGADAYRTYCLSCHGVGGRGATKGSSIVDG